MSLRVSAHKSMPVYLLVSVRTCVVHAPDRSASTPCGGDLNYKVDGTRRELKLEQSQHGTSLLLSTASLCDKTIPDDQCINDIRSSTVGLQHIVNAVCDQLQATLATATAMPTPLPAVNVIEVAAVQEMTAQVAARIVELIAASGQVNLPSTASLLLWHGQGKSQVVAPEQFVAVAL